MSLSPLELLVKEANKQLKATAKPAAPKVSSGQKKSIERLVGKPKLKPTPEQIRSMDALVKGKPQEAKSSSLYSKKPVQKSSSARPTLSAPHLAKLQAPPSEFVCNNFTPDYVLQGSSSSIKIPAATPLDEEQPEYEVLYNGYTVQNAISLVYFSRGPEFASRYYGYLITGKLL